MPRHSDTASDEDDMEEEEEEVTTTSAGRVYKHVLPRIDPDSYQCSVFTTPGKSSSHTAK
jgi:hypothetical protein